MYGKSVSNQRIEAWWGQLRRGCMDWWINYFKDLRDNGLYCDSDIFHTECLRFCFMPILKEELNKVAILWNLHRIRRSTNPESPPERPDMLYFMPEINNTRDYKTALDMDDVDVVGETLGLQGEHLNCSPDFMSLANIVMRENGLLMPSDADGARSLYIELLGHVKDVEAGL